MLSPHQLIQSLVEDYRAGKKTREGFLEGVAEAERFTAGFAAQMRALELPFGDSESESVKKLQEACLARFASAIAEMRQAVEMRDMALCDKALDLSGQGDSLVSEILLRTAG